MRLDSLLYFLVLPFLACGQTITPRATAASTPSATVILSTSLITSIVLGSNRQESTVTTNTVITITSTPAVTSSASGNISTNGTTASGNSTQTGNSTQVANATSSTSSTTPFSLLPTAATSIDGGGNGPNGAPLPGATAGGGIYGPPDGYVAAALALQRSAAVVAVVASGIAGALMVL